MFHHLSFRAKMWSLLAANFIIAATLVLFAYGGIRSLDESISRQSAAATVLRAEVMADMFHEGMEAAVLRAILTANTDAGNLVAREEELKNVREVAASFRDNMRVLEGSRILDKEARVLLKQAQEEVERYLNLGESLAILAFQDRNRAKDQLATFMNQFEALETRLVALADAIEAEIKRTEQTAGAASDSAYQSLIAVAIVGLAFIILISLLVQRSLFRQLGAEPADLGAATRAIAKGILGKPLTLRADDESSVLGDIEQMRQNLAEAAATNATRLLEAERLAAALENAGSNIMLADRDRKIIFVNKSFRQAFKKIAADIQQRFPRFDPESLVGLSMDQFHQNPQHQAKMLEHLNTQHVITVAIGAHTFRITANPVFGANGERVGSVAEWYDLTDELAQRTAERAQFEENARIRTALDSVSTPVMISDNDNIINYLNHAMERNMAEAEADIRQSIAGFNAKQLLGKPTSLFMGGSSKAANSDPKLLDTLHQTFRVNMKVGTRTYAMTVNPVLTDQGERLGSVMEWQDRTAEIAGEKRVVLMVNEASRGNLQERIDLNTLPEGFLRDCGAGVNRILDAVVQPIEDIVGVLEAMAQGDLTVRMTAEYEGIFGRLKDDANITLEKLAQSVHVIKEAAEAINTASREISMGNTDLSQRTEQQAASLEQTASNMVEIASTVKQNADNATQANQMAVNASDVAARGGLVVQQVVGTMHNINESSRKIVDIISVIDGIAFQTNILALNAAVEAARAGEQGRGFAVVAGEVRTLAQRSAAAAKEIKELINDSVAKVADGSRLVEEAGRTMEDIVTSVRDVTGIMAGIASASVEQSANLGNVNESIAKMDETTQQNAALVEQAAAAAESLEEQAGTLAEAVSQFKLGQASKRKSPARALRQVATTHKAPSKLAFLKADATSSNGDDWAEF